ncbi:NUDIX hydrolase-like protein [Gracilaria domingensis]|nr:NUDIX hydrolase-like protein [Gracilaria domingensis]
MPTESRSARDFSAPIPKATAPSLRRLGFRSVSAPETQSTRRSSAYIGADMAPPSPPPPRISQTALFLAFLALLGIAGFAIPGGLAPRRETEEILSRRIAERLDVFSESDPYQRIDGPVHIEEIHKNGLVHHGVWMFALDSHLRLLLAWRSPSTKTCPMTWTPIGEHSITNETFEETTERGLAEEARFIIRPRVFAIGKPFFFHYVYANGTQEQRTDKQWTQAYVILPRGDALDFRSLDDIDAQAIQSYGENLRYQGMSIPEVVRHGVQKPDYFCNKVLVKWILRTIPLVIRVLKTKEKRLFRAHLRDDWGSLVQSGSPVCCRSSEHEVDVESVDVSACGIPCEKHTIDVSDEETFT